MLTNECIRNPEQVGMMGVYDKWGQRHPCTILAVRRSSMPSSCLLCFALPSLAFHHHVNRTFTLS